MRCVRSSGAADSHSRDGRQVMQSGSAGLNIRDLASLAPSVLPGVKNAAVKVSPDGRWLACFQAGSVRKIPIEGGASSEVGQCGPGLDWLDANSIVCQGRNNGLARVPSAGGPVELLTTPDTATGEIGHWGPMALPGGRAVLFTSYRRPASRVEAIELESRRRVVIAENGFRPIYARSGHVLFVRGNALFAVRFDPVKLRPECAPVLALDDVVSQPSEGMAAISISDNGTLAVLRQSEYAVDARVVWVTRDGKESPAIPSTGAFRTPRMSPDQSRILVTVGADGTVRNLRMYDLQRELLTQVTRATASALNGVWAPDGREVVFTNETPSYDIYRMALDGSGKPTAVVSNTADKLPVSLSPDGTEVAYYSPGIFGSRVRVALIAGSGPGRAIGDTSIFLSAGVFSPDGRWLAVVGPGTAPGGNSVRLYRSDGTPGVIQVTAGDSADWGPRWTRGGRELVFRRGTAVFAVDVDLAAGQVGKPHKLFDGAYPAALGFDAASDGNPFLLVKHVDRPGTLPLLVITNFFDELRKKVGP